MTYTIDCTARLAGDAQSIWDTWTDMASYPNWDPREEELRIDGPFAVGTTGFSKQAGPRAGTTFELTRVEPITRWTNECPLPGGRLVLDHYIETMSDGRVSVLKRYQVHGPLEILFRLFFGRGIRAGAPATFAALEAEALRRTSV
ncbi:MAG: hypothetical protein JWO10_781 [Microbacteriaceae bacterium]|nr:hypothetical protein [Microbacteriaceae bacterium]